MSIPQELLDLLSGTSIAEPHAKRFLELLTESLGLYGMLGDVKTRTRLTPEGGIAIKLVNKTGAASAKGTLVEAHETIDKSFETLPADGDDPIGVVYENAVPDGEECWVVISGAAEALLEDGKFAGAGNWVTVSPAQAGRVDAEAAAPPGSGVIAEIQEHFKEVGHCLETKSLGTSVLALCVIHFN